MSQTQAVRIRCATDHPFPLDLLVRTPKELAWRLQEGDWFCQEIVERGKVLYEQVDRRVDVESRERSNRRHKTVKGSSTCA